MFTTHRCLQIEYIHFPHYYMRYDVIVRWPGSSAALERPLHNTHTIHTHTDTCSPPCTPCQTHTHSHSDAMYNLPHWQRGTAAATFRMRRRWKRLRYVLSNDHPSNSGTPPPPHSRPSTVVMVLVCLCRMREHRGRSSRRQPPFELGHFPYRSKYSSTEYIAIPAVAVMGVCVCVRVACKMHAT